MRIVFAGGGTGGHLYPALALARFIREQDPQAEILFLGREKGLESRVIPKEGFELKLIRTKTPVRKLSLAMFVSLTTLAGGMFKAIKIVRKFSPHVVVGTGGYVSVPVVLAAVLLRVPVILHEQNVIPGVANKKLSTWVNVTCLSFPESARYFPRKASLKVTGNPRATEAAATTLTEKGYKLLGLKPGRKTLLIAGGSQGAMRVNQAAVEAICRLESREDLQVLYATGERYYEDVMKQVNFPEKGLFVKVTPYIENMPLALAVADLIISRAGATTLAEVNALGTPAIIVPSPNVTNDHQSANARVLEERNAAIVIKEKDLTGDNLFAAVLRVLDNPNLMQTMKEASLGLAYPRASASMYNSIRKNISPPGK